MTRDQIARLLATTDLEELHRRCGISARTIARATGIHHGTIINWEARRRNPAGASGIRYMRIIAALRAHDDITRQLEAEEATGRSTN